MRLRVLDLFSGIGGISLGLESTGGFETVAFCEIEPFPREVLAHRWPGVPVYDDVRTLTARALPDRIDVVVGGFPCQDISIAGKGAGIEGARSGLWSEMFRIVREVRPRWVVAENVPALRTRGADRVLSDLEAQGYTVWPLVVGAWAVRAEHERNRAWIIAHDPSKRMEGVWASRNEKPRALEATPLPLRDCNGQWQVEPDLRRAVYGFPRRVDRLRALGNSVVPQVVRQVGLAILKAEDVTQ